MKLLFKPQSGQICKFYAILAMDRKGHIGYDGKLIFHNPSDLQYFKMQTLHKICIMGRKTFESIGKILPERQTIVLTKQDIDQYREKCLKTYVIPENTPEPIFMGGDDIMEQLSYIMEELDKPAFVCGGAEIYHLFAPYTFSWLATVYKTDVTKMKGFLPEDYDPKLLVTIKKSLLGQNWMTSANGGKYQGVDYVYREYDTKPGITLPASTYQY